MVLATAVILSVAVFARAVYWAQYTSQPAGQLALGADAMEYDAWARRMLVLGPLWDRLHIHAPLYPALLAIFYRITGVSIPAARALQLGMDLLSMAMVSVAVWRLVNRRAALVTAAVWALYQPLIYYSAELFSEVLVVFLTSAVLLFWALAQPSQGEEGVTRWWLVASCWLAGLMVIAHPLSIVLAGPYTAYAMAVIWRDGEQRRRALFSMAGCALLFVLPMSAVTARNLAVSGQVVFVQANQGLNLYIGNNPEATGTCYVRPGPDYDALVAWPSRSAGIATQSGARAFFRNRVLRFAREHPYAALSLWMRKALLTWNASDITSGPDLPQMQVLTSFMRVPLLRFGLVGPLALIAWLWYDRRRLRPVLWAPLFGTLALTVFVTSGRYRLPMTPALIAGAAIGVEALIQWWRRNDQNACIAGALLAAAGVAVALLLPPPPIPSSHSETVLLLAEAAWRRGDTSRALNLLVNGLDRRRFNAPMHHLLGNVLEDQGRLPEAIGAFQEALRIDPRRAAAALDLGIALSRLGLQADAAAALSLASELDPDDPDVAYNVGVWHERRGNLTQAETAYRRALRGNPVHSSAHLNLGVLLQKSDRPEKARAHYNTVLALQPGNDKALAGLAVYHAMRGDKGPASAYFQKAIDANPAREDLREALRALDGQQTDPAPAPSQPSAPEPIR